MPRDAPSGKPWRAIDARLIYQLVKTSLNHRSECARSARCCSSNAEEHPTRYARCVTSLPCSNSIPHSNSPTRLATSMATPQSFKSPAASISTRLCSCRIASGHGRRSNSLRRSSSSRRKRSGLRTMKRCVASPTVPGEISSILWL
jgi:hypothetical protein